MGIRNNQNIKIVKKSNIPSVNIPAKEFEKHSIMDLFNNTVPDHFTYPWMDVPLDYTPDQKLMKGFARWKKIRKELGPDNSVLLFLDFMEKISGKSHLTRNKKPLRGNKEFTELAVKLDLLVKKNDVYYSTGYNSDVVDAFANFRAHVPFDWPTIINGDSGTNHPLFYYLRRSSSTMRKALIVKSGDEDIITNCLWNNSVSPHPNLSAVFFVSKPHTNEFENSTESTTLINEESIFLDNNFADFKNCIGKILEEAGGKNTVEMKPLAINRDYYDTAFTGRVKDKQYFFRINNNNLQLLQKMYGTDLDFYFVDDENLPPTNDRYVQAFCKYKDKLVYTEKLFLLDTSVNNNWRTTVLNNVLPPLLSNYQKA